MTGDRKALAGRDWLAPRGVLVRDKLAKRTRRLFP